MRSGHENQKLVSCSAPLKVRSVNYISYVGIDINQGFFPESQSLKDWPETTTTTQKSHQPSIENNIMLLEEALAGNNSNGEWNVMVPPHLMVRLEAVHQ